MRKILFSILCGTILAVPNSYAVTAGASVSGDCGSVILTAPDMTITPEDTSLPSSAMCSSTGTIAYRGESGGGVTTMNYKKTYCTACRSGYVLAQTSGTSTRVRNCTVTWTTCVEDAPCVGLVCEGKTTWTNHPQYSSNHNQMRCDTSNDTCEFRCAAGYYDNGRYTLAGSTTPCSACPDNATCAAGGTPSCRKNYYRTSTTVAITGATIYSCPACPTLGDNEVAGLTSTSGATSISRCYIPSNTNISVTEGTYQFTSNCNYTMGVVVGPGGGTVVTPVEPAD